MKSAYLPVFKNQKLLQIKSAKGIYINTINGKLLDTTSGNNNFCVLGWGHPKINKAIEKQLKKFSHIDIKQFHDKNIDILSNILIKNSKHKLNKVFYTGNSGAEACEAACRLALQYFKNLKIKSKKKIFISRKQSYHGCTDLCINLGDRPNNNAFAYKNMFFKKINEHNPINKIKNNETFEQYENRTVKELEDKIKKIGSDNICAFVGETIMGGLQGDIPPTKNYWKKIRQVCNKYNILMIIDEVYCGLGSSGKYFCIDYDNASPDIIFTGKILAAGYSPISALVTSKKISDVLNKTNRINYSTTYQGFSLGISAAIAVQKIVNDKAFLNKIYKKGKYMRQVLNDELKSLDTFKNVRGRGLRFSLEHNFKENNLTALKLSKIMLNKHNILINSKWHRTCFTPAFIISFNQINYVLENFIKEFKKIS